MNSNKSLLSSFLYMSEFTPYDMLSLSIILHPS
jgi:hypothetical protein